MERDNSRFIINSKGSCIKPNDEIVCKNCIFRDTTSDIGYKKGICKKYKNKPLEILFKNQHCIFYKK